MIAVKIRRICYVETAANLRQLGTSLSAPAKKNWKTIAIAYL